VIIGWSHYYAHVVSARVFQKLDHILFAMLCAWAGYRHPNKKKYWTTSKYWSDQRQLKLFQRQLKLFTDN
jgi:RNA-directed DNA polymerase